MIIFRLKPSLLALWAMVLLLMSVACADLPDLRPGDPPPPYPVDPAPTAVPAPAYPGPQGQAPATASAPAPTAVPPAGPQVMAYSLGDAGLTQDWFPEESRFREMPVRLEGLIGVPAAGENHPVVLILHGNHPGCPVDETGVDRWPCAIESEQANYRGWEYLVTELAARGYLVLAPNINAEYTLGYGEPLPGVRLRQLISLHLGALGRAGAAEASAFPLPLDGRVDLSQMDWIGHSQGGELGSLIIREDSLDEALGAGYAGYGPVRGLLQVAPSVSLVAPEPVPDLPLATILPSCDADVMGLEGQRYFEAARDDRARANIATSALLFGANHNSFNTILPPDRMPAWRNPECAAEFLLSPEEQRNFLSAYTVDFLNLTLGPAAMAADAAARLGLTQNEVAPSELYGLAAVPLASGAARDELLLLRPFAEEEAAQNLAGGAITSRNLDVTFCPLGYFTPEMEPERRACRRVDFNQPAYPRQLALAWTEPTAELVLELPGGQQDLRALDALHLRAALDPLTEGNEFGAPLSFRVALTDATGAQDMVEVQLPFPIGESGPNEFFGGEIFTGHVHMSDVRLPLVAFEGLDLSRITAVTLLFDQQERGAIFLADAGFRRAARYPGSSSTLLTNSDGFLDPLAGVGRLQGTVDCTAVLVDSGGGPASPAYLLSSGHCVQEWDPNAVLLDQPAQNMQVIFNYFVDTQQRHIGVPAARVAYSTMKGRDLAVIELAATLGALAQLGVQPLAVASAPAEGPLPLQVVGAPQTGIDLDGAYLRHERCEMDGRADLLEYNWHFYDSYRTTCRDISGGSAGSPVFAAAGEELFALIQSSTVGARHPCYLGAPCEITPGGVEMRRDASYATPVDGLGACFGADGRFDLAQEGCPLDDGRQLALSGAPTRPVQPQTTREDGTDIPATWNAALDGDLPYYRVKTGAVGTVDCRDEEGYGAVIAVAEQPRFDDPLPATGGRSLLCLVAGNSAVVDEGWQQTAVATVAQVEVDSTPPRGTAVLDISRRDGLALIQPVYDPPELADFYLKAGPVDGTDCAVEEGYFPYRRVPLAAPVDDLPWTVCIIAQDMAGNAAPAVAREVAAGNAP